MSTPVLRQQRPALVIAPPASDLQVPWRKSFAPKPEATNKCPRSIVARLEVRLYAMELQLSERPPQSQRKTFGHVSTTRMRHKCIVTKVGTPKSTVHDLANVDHAGEVARRSKNYQAPVVGRLQQAPDVRVIRLRRAGRWRPPPKEGPAASSSFQESRLVKHGWSSQLNSHLSGIVSPV